MPCSLSSGWDQPGVLYWGAGAQVVSCCQVYCSRTQGTDSNHPASWKKGSGVQIALLDWGKAKHDTEVWSRFPCWAGYLVLVPTSVCVCRCEARRPCQHPVTTWLHSDKQPLGPHSSLNWMALGSMSPWGSVWACYDLPVVWGLGSKGNLASPLLPQHMTLVEGSRGSVVR
jgi:hypothetical protein